MEEHKGRESSCPGPGTMLGKPSEESTFKHVGEGDGKRCGDEVPGSERSATNAYSFLTTLFLFPFRFHEFLVRKNVLHALQSEWHSL
jgi:hypothetical protein